MTLYFPRNKDRIPAFFREQEMLRNIFPDVSEDS
jgi:hypothetical protein